jgi:hypothetical protein
MIKALAPTMPRGCWWLLLSIVLTMGLPRAVRAQTEKKAADSTKPAPKSTGPSAKEAPKSGAAEKDEPAKKEEPAGEDEDDKSPGIEIFKDTRAEDALKVEIRSIGKLTNDTTIRQVKIMAGGAANPDRETIRRFVDGMTYLLTNANNIKALIDPNSNASPSSSTARAVKEATADLLDPIYTAKATNNEAFLKMYGQVLIEKLPPLLKSHLIPRVEAMIVLGQLGSPDAMDIYTKQLTDPDQTVWVKLWAARGIDNATLHGRREVQGLAAAKALADMLRKETLPWPVQMRALEALGALRIAADPRSSSKADLASAAMGFLADPDARFEVRAAAAWAIGMMRGTSAISGFNYRLVAYNIGQVTAYLGEEVGDAFKDDKVRAEYWTGVLLNPIFHAVYGEPEARDSGLLKTSNNLAAVKQVADLVRPIAEKSILLIRTPGGNAEKAKQDLSAQVAALRSFLEKNPPGDGHLVPKGDEFPLKKAQVAQAPAGNVRVVAVPGGQ